MNYTTASFYLKLRKLIRYIRLYGPDRTFMKVKGQSHMKAEETFEGDRWVNPNCSDPDHPARNIAILGCGNYAYANIAYYLSKADKRFLRAAYDLSRPRTLSMCKGFGAAYAAGDPSQIVNDPAVKMVFIASNHASHAEYAIELLDAGKHVHIEKPHVVTDEQLVRLIAAMRRNPKCKVFLGFNRPKSVLFRKLSEVLAKESGPMMINWFIAGHEIPDDHWYFNEKEGGRVLGNLCHWTDLTLRLVGMEKVFPCTIVPATLPRSKSDFVVAVLFGDRSCAGLTFSAKGQTFEGVRELLNVHKGAVLANLSDFQTLTHENGPNRTRSRLPFRDHGHRQNFFHSHAGLKEGGSPGESLFETAATARFFLAVREAVESGKTVVVTREEIEKLIS